MQNHILFQGRKSKEYHEHPVEKSSAQHRICTTEFQFPILGNLKFHENWKVVF